MLWRNPIQILQQAKIRHDKANSIIFLAYKKFIARPIYVLMPSLKITLSQMHVYSNHILICNEPLKFLNCIFVLNWKQRANYANVISISETRFVHSLGFFISTEKIFVREKDNFVLKY